MRKATKKPAAVAKAKPAAKPAVVKEPIAEPVAAPALPVFDGVQVVEILASGHTATQKHCRMADGTTRHVPTNLF